MAKEKRIETLYEKYLILNDENKKKILAISRVLVLTQNNIIPSIREAGPDKKKANKK